MLRELLLEKNPSILVLYKPVWRRQLAQWGLQLLMPSRIHQTTSTFRWNIQQYFIYVGEESPGLTNLLMTNASCDVGYLILYILTIPLGIHLFAFQKRSSPRLWMNEQAFDAVLCCCSEGLRCWCAHNSGWYIGRWLVILLHVGLFVRWPPFR